MGLASFLKKIKINNISFDTNVLVGLVLYPNNVQLIDMVLHDEKYDDRLAEKISTKISEYVINETITVLEKMDEDPKKINKFIETNNIFLIPSDNIDNSVARSLIKKVNTKVFQDKIKKFQTLYKKHGSDFIFELPDARIVASLLRGEVNFVFSNDPAFRLLANAARLIGEELKMTLN